MAGTTIRAPARETADFVAGIEQEMRRPGRWLADHPVVGKLERGELSRGQIAGLMGQIYRQTCEVVRWLGALYARCPVMEIRRDLFNNLLEEELGGFSNTDAHFHLAARVAVAAGAERSALDGVALQPGTRALIDYGDALYYDFDDPHWIKGFGAAFGFESQSPVAFDAIAKALTNVYGMTRDEAMFFEVHVSADEDHGDAIVRVFDSHARGEEERRMVRDCALRYSELYYGMLSTYEAYP